MELIIMSIISNNICDKKKKKESSPENLNT